MLDDYLRTVPITCNSTNCREHHGHGLEVKKSEAGFDLREINYDKREAVRSPEPL